MTDEIKPTYECFNCNHTYWPYAKINGKSVQIRCPKCKDMDLKECIELRIKLPITIDSFKIKIGKKGIINE